MNNKWINILALILLVAAVVGSSACSLTRIKAQSTTQKPIADSSKSTVDSSDTAYKPSKRVSKDIIKSDEKPKSEEKPSKTKKK